MNASSDEGQRRQLLDDVDADQKINILIVDDEPKNLTVLETVLDDPGYRLIRADCADKALLALLSDEFALIILDISMPDVSGFELATIIKARKKTSLVPIIFLTAHYNEDQHVVDGYGAGAVDYLHKPVNPTILRSKVAVFADLHRKRLELAASNRAMVAEVNDRLRAEESLRELNETLELRIQERTEALRESERRYRQMIDALPAAVYTTDAHGRITHFNPAAEILCGRSPDPTKDRWCIGWKLYQADGTPLQHEASPMARALKEGQESAGIEIIIERPDGSRLNVLSYPTPMRDDDGRIAGGIDVLVDVSERKRSETQIRLLINEVNHRSKNMLAVVEAISRQTAARNPQDFVKNFSNRVRALAASHDLLVKNEWQGIDISELVRSQLAHFEDIVDKRIVISGPSMRLTVAAAQCIGMVVHELSTNAVKHGALSNQTGSVEVAWSKDGQDRFKMSWIERGGPPVVAPEQRGFGWTVVKAMAEMNLEGQVELDYAPSGLIWRLDCPSATSLDGRNND